MRRLLFGVACLFLVSAGFAQNVGDQYTAGYTHSRTYLNSDMGDFQPPLAVSQTIMLTGVTNAASLLAFNTAGGKRILVGEPTSANVIYRLYDGATGNALWMVTLPGPSLGLRYTPAYSGDVALLGGSTSAGVAAVRVSTGTLLWQDKTLGSATGRQPVLTNGLALYGGEAGIATADPVGGPGPSFWVRSVTTAEAPISLTGQRAYYLEESGSLRSVDVKTGLSIWERPNVGGNHPNIIATEGVVLLNSSAGGLFGAIRASDSSGIWSRNSGMLSQTPPLALAYDQLFVFTADSGTGNAEVSAHNANTGDPIWSETEDGPGIDFGLAANNIVYYYHGDSGRIRARDAFTGNLVWSWKVNGVRGLAAADGKLFVLLADRILVFEAINEIYFAQIADGGGQRTLVTLNNRAPAPAMGTLSFLDDDGNPLILSLAGGGTASSFAFAIPARSSTGFQTLGSDSQARRGWAQVTSNRPLTGSSIFSFRSGVGPTANEAGVADSPATGRGTVFLEVALPPVRSPSLSTGVAIANASNEAAVVTYRLLDRFGMEIAVFMETLNPDAHVAKFVEQIFPVVIGASFTGTLLIESDVPVVATALRTQDGLQLSSYEVGQ